MGLVPTYAAVGAAAPIIFLILRVIQGLFVGGVTATTHTLGTESVPERWRGLMRLENSWNLQISNVALPVRQVWRATHALL
ncbi:hypothetical protein [Pseudarthrobacter sp. SSS035]|uniref:hypothetical protein n=1 Tax=Pseudarthrobacter sp. SSS035 TaxID=2931399 RepID=UPI00200DBD18|nr:hypothetical protein [Pseudarthrobacter sp. SSS035]